MSTVTYIYTYIYTTLFYRQWARITSGRPVQPPPPRLSLITLSYVPPSLLITIVPNYPDEPWSLADWVRPSRLSAAFILSSVTLSLGTRSCYRRASTSRRSSVGAYSRDIALPAHNRALFPEILSRRWQGFVILKKIFFKAIIGKFRILKSCSWIPHFLVNGASVEVRGTENTL